MAYARCLTSGSIGGWAMAVTCVTTAVDCIYVGGMDLPFRMLVLSATLVASVGCSGSDPLPEPEPLIFETQSLAPTTVGETYSQVLEASGGSGAYIFSISQGELPPGLLLGAESGSTQGLLSGEPQLAGSFDFSIAVEDAGGQRVERAFTLVVDGPLSLMTASLPEGRSNEAYEASVSASGGVGPYAWTIVSGALPAGLTLATGPERTTQITGVLAASGMFEFSIQVEDAEGAQAQAAFSIQVAAGQLALHTNMLPAAAVGIPYRQELLVSGGSPPYRWRSTGTLPGGMVVARDGIPGQIVGTPNAEGSYSFEVEVTDGNNTKARAALTLLVVQPLVIDTATLTAGEVGQPYLQTLSASGGEAPYLWQTTQSDLPPGLGLGLNDGTISGTPTSPGDYQIVVRLSDAQALMSEKTFQITIAPEPEPLTIALSPQDPDALPAGQADFIYGAPVRALGGTAPFSWSLVSGTLPTGFVLSGETSASLLIAGTTTAVGAYPLTLRVEDSRGNVAEKSATLVINPALALSTTALSPAPACEPYRAELIATGGSGTAYSWSVTPPLPAGLTLRQDGTTTATLEGAALRSALGAGAYTFSVTDDSTGASVSRILQFVVEPTTSSAGWVLTMGGLNSSTLVDAFLIDTCSIPAARQQVSPPPSRPDPGSYVYSTNRFAAAWSPDGTKVAFTGDYNEIYTHDVYVADVRNGVMGAGVRVSNPSAATNNYRARQLTFSADSSRLSFVANGETEDHQDLYVVDTSVFPIPPASAQRVTFDTSGAQTSIRSTAFSDDGQRLAFTWSNNLRSFTWVVDTSSVGQVAVPVRSDFSVGGSSPVWIPGTRRFVIAEQGDLLRVDAESMPPSNIDLRGSASGHVSVAGLTEDAQSVWYVADERSNSAEIFLVDLSAPGITRPAHAGLSGADTIVEATRLAGDDGLLVYGTVSGSQGLYLIDLGGSGTQLPAAVSAPLSPGATINSDSVRWSADGRWVGYMVDEVAGTHTHAYATRINGAMVGAHVRISPASPPAAVDLDYMVFSPDGTGVVVRGNYASASRPDALVADLTAADPSATWSRVTATGVDFVNNVYFPMPGIVVLQGTTPQNRFQGWVVQWRLPGFPSEDITGVGPVIRIFDL